MRHLLFLALVMIGWVARATPDCSAVLTRPLRSVGLFPRGVALRLPTTTVQIRAAAEKTLDFVREGEQRTYTDRILVPMYTYDRTDRVDLTTLRVTGWEYALFDGSEWVDSGTVDQRGDDEPQPGSFGPAIYTRHWRALHTLSHGPLKALRRIFKDAPVYELRILNAPAHHVRALWLHNGTDDVFISSNRERLVILDEWHMTNLIDAGSLNAIENAQP